MIKLKYQPKDFESKWIKRWEDEQVYKTGSQKGRASKMYTLVMFPYPSGVGLHTGHARVYTGTDVLARYFRMNGKAVLHPMGWDAFGLPAENAAIKSKQNPEDLTKENIKNFKRQMQALGLSYDWNREINTTDPEYYAITQQLFIEFYKRGLLYKKDTPVFYCDFCKTGLAQEEVMGDGTHERCGNEVIKRNLPQWIFRITTYADSLLKGLEGLDWPNGILEMQRNWIGKKQGINITYEIENTHESITCFTTRPDTNFGATFIVLAPEHNLVEKIITKIVNIKDKAQYKSIETYVSTSLRKTERERLSEEKTKTGVFTGLYAINKLNNMKLPIWISDFVLENVGTGAVVGVPGHDKRDFEFAKAFNLDITRVVVGADNDMSKITNIKQVQESEGKMINSGFLNGMDIYEATNKMMNHIEDKGWGKRVTSYHLRDWIFSRQRYWGEPIPMVFCQSCADRKVSYWNSQKAGRDELGLDKGPKNKTFGNMVKDIEGQMYGWFPIETKNLPLELPHVDSYKPLESSESPLAAVSDWVKTSCPHCGGQAERETDTMPNWAGSCWYFLRFAKKKNSEFNIMDSEVSYWNPVDWYIGGTEHAVLHLLYARFWIHALNDIGLLPFREPFKALRSVGMVIAEDHRKMSKSWDNVINPDDIVEKYGADALRVYEMFMAPFSQEVAWSVRTLQGAYRFLNRIWQIYNTPARLTDEDIKYDFKVVSELQSTIDKVTSDIPNVKFNTSIAACMQLLNVWEKSDKPLPAVYAKQYLQLLALFAPFITDEIWRNVFSERNSIHLSTWPSVDQNFIQNTNIIIPVQIDGKVRDTLSMNPDVMSKDVVVKNALASEKIKKWIGNHTYKAIYIERKILNLVLLKS